ncbi:LysR family transcriptional regulator [Cognatiyoonia sp. IB215182]|uniref:LysR family transcriptional regulator n=1 Tax=Cognatiyoonia sp. IB215182 TaxID=3097353 RepID=UPI002A138BEB|nr:LysR family transcriptional regulator [Cognatiyoonia sp. IB215182]MDX8355024.1 LysR family transcriptional regulator [Cognatiyoonia sp. IB215182]
MLAILDYEAVIAIAEEGHFGRAARRLGMTQPALSSRLRRIEEHLDARLFERDRGGVRLTPAGEQFLEGAERVIVAANEAADSARSAQAGLGQTLRIGMTQIAAYQVVVPTLLAFRELHPRARLRLYENTTAALERQLEQSRIDVAFIHPPFHAPGLTERKLASVRLARFNAKPDEKRPRPLIRFPRAEAPVLMGQIGRADADYDGPFPDTEADTMLGAIVLSRAGFGPFVAPEDYPSPFEKSTVCLDHSPTDMVLETSVVYRSLDRRPLLSELVKAAKASCGDRP